MPYWRFPSESVIKAVDCSATHVRRVSWQPGHSGLLAFITNQGGRLVNTGIVKKDSVEFGVDMGWMEELAWSPAGDMLATVGDRAIIWNSNGTFNRELQEAPMGPRRSDTPKFSNDGSFIVLSIVTFDWPDTNHREFRKFDTSTGALQQTLRISSPFIPMVAWKDELEVFSRGENNTLNLWRIGQEEPLQTITLTVPSYVNKMSFNPKMNILAFKTGPTVRLWKMDTPDMAVTILAHDAPVKKFVWQSDNSDILATVDCLGDVRIWETTSNTNLHVYNVFTMTFGWPFHASFSPNGRFVAVGRDGEVKIVKFDTGGTVAVCEGSGGDVTWSPRGDKLAVNTANLDAYVFNVDKINFGINLKGLSQMRVARLLEGNLVNGKEEARNFLKKEIPEKLVNDVLPYLK